MSSVAWPEPMVTSLSVVEELCVHISKSCAAPIVSSDGTKDKGVH